MIAVGPIGGALTIRKGLNPQLDGSFTISNVDDSTMTVDANGVERVSPPEPAGSTGQFQKCTRDGNLLFFWVGPNPDWNGVHAYAYQLVEHLPNDAQ